MPHPTWNGNVFATYSFPLTEDVLLVAVFVPVDTIIVHDTTYITVTDTIYIHDTVYITQEGIGDVDAMNVKLYQRDGEIVVEGAEGQPVVLYDAVGRMVATRKDSYAEVRLDVLSSGAYLIQVGNRPARRVVVVK